jgi:hypothetical protein
MLYEYDLRMWSTQFCGGYIMAYNESDFEAVFEANWADTCSVAKSRLRGLLSGLSGVEPDKVETVAPGLEIEWSAWLPHIAGLKQAAGGVLFVAMVYNLMADMLLQDNNDRDLELRAFVVIETARKLASQVTELITYLELRAK